MATDSLYIQKRALHKLEGVEAYVPMPSDKEIWVEILEMSFKVKETKKDVGPAQWREKGKLLYLRTSQIADPINRTAL